MRHLTLPLLCGTALALMTGAVASHYVSTAEMINLAQSLPTESIATDPLLNHTEPSDTHSLIAQLRQQNSSMQQSLSASQQNLASMRKSGPAEQGQTDSYPDKSIANGGTDPQLNQVLRELIAINSDLKKQIAETNRDIMDLRFQVDTHSEQFRPLQAAEDQSTSVEQQYDSGIGVLPPLDLE